MSPLSELCHRSVTGKKLVAAVDARPITGAVILTEVAEVTRHLSRQVTRLATMTW